MIFLHNHLDDEGGAMRRGLQLIKMRGTPIDSNIHPMAFTEDGLGVDTGAKVQV